MDAFSSPTVLISISHSTSKTSQRWPYSCIWRAQARYGTYHISVEMRRPTPTQSMNTTQRRSFSIFKNPMSSTKANPTVDTERKIYKIYSDTLLGLGIQGKVPALQMLTVQWWDRQINKPPPQHVLYMVEKCKPPRNTKGPLRYFKFTEAPIWFTRVGQHSDHHQY